MKKNWTLTQKAFESLLRLLDEDTEKAGQKYLRIRERLTKIFICRGFSDAEDLADEAINRVADKSEELSKTYIGERGSYFYRVANLILLEANRRKEITVADFPVMKTTFDTSDEDKIMEMDCLEECLEELPNEQRTVILQYYEDEKSAKILKRAALAKMLDIEISVLRLRMTRMRDGLRKCVKNCLQKK